jgi:hypothetical protein
MKLASYGAVDHREPTPWPCFCMGDFRGFATVIGRVVQRGTIVSYRLRLNGGAELTVPAADVRPKGNIVGFVAGRDDWEGRP